MRNDIMPAKHDKALQQDPRSQDEARQHLWSMTPTEHTPSWAKWQDAASGGAPLHRLPNPLAI